MQYLQPQPFSVALGTKQFAENWDRIFAKKTETKERDTLPDEDPPDTERAPPPTPVQE